MTGRELAALSGQDSIVAIRRPFVKWLGNVGRALLLDQLLYYSDRFDGEWFTATDEDWMQHLCLTRTDLRDARAFLVEHGYIETARRGMPARLWYRVDLERVGEAFTAFLTEDSARPVRRFRPTSSAIPPNMLGDSASPSIYKVDKGEEEGIFLTEDSGTHEPAESTKATTEPLTLVDSSAKPSGAFTAAVRPALVDILAGGEESLALNGKTGRDAAWVGRCLGMLGRWTNTDADAAIAWLGWWRRSEQWRFRGASPHKWPAAMAAARDAYNDRPAATGQRGPIDLDRRVDFERPRSGAAGRSRGPVDLDRR